MLGLVSKYIVIFDGFGIGIDIRQKNNRSIYICIKSIA